MKIVMLGTGSLGSTIGGTLAQGGSEVYFVDMWKEHIDAVNQHGLHMTDEETDWYVKVDGRTNAEGIGPADLVIVLVKSFATKSAVTELKETSVIGPDTMVMSLQNGLGNEEAIASVVGNKNVISGKTYVGGRLLEPYPHQPAQHRHQRLKTAKPHTHHSRFFPCGPAHGKPFTYRHGKSIHRQANCNKK